MNHTPIVEPQAKTTLRFRRAWAISIFMTMLVLFVPVRNLIQDGFVDDQNQTRFIVIFILLNIGFFFNFMKRVEIGGLAFLSAILYMIFDLMSSSNGLGIVLSVIFGLVGSVVINLTFRRKWSLTGFIVIGTISLLVISYDLFLHELLIGSVRTNLGRAEIITTGITAGIALLIFGLYAFRDFRNFTLQVKLISVISFLISVSILITTITTSIIGTQFALDKLGRTGKAAGDSSAQTIRANLTRDLGLIEELTVNPFVKSDIDIQNSSYRFSTDENAVAKIVEIQGSWADLSQNRVPRVLALSRPSVNYIESSLDNLTQTMQVVAALDKFGGVAASSQFIPQYYYGDEAWWSELKEEGQIIRLMPDDGETEMEGSFAIDNVPVAPYLNVNSGPILILGQAVYDDITGEFIGAVIGRSYLISYGFFFEQDLENSVYEEVGFLIADNTHEIEIEYYPNRQMVVEEEDIENEIAELQQQMGSDNFGLISHDRVDVVASLSPIYDGETSSSFTDLTWQVLIFQDQTLAQVGRLTEERAQVLIGFLVLILGIGIAITLGRIISRPVIQLSEVATQIAQGSLDVRVEKITTEDEVGQLAQTFNTMADQVQTSVTELENRVEQRTQALEATNRISRQISSILNQEKLLETIVRELVDDFNYYHAHIYLLSAGQDRLVMTYGSGEVGQQLKERGHFLPLGQGLVGRAADTGISILVSDVRQNPEWTPNDLLPDTKAELAVPIAYGNEILGVIDIQDNKINGLSEQDRTLIESITGPLANSLRNARFYQEAETRGQREATINEIRRRILEAQDVDAAFQIAAAELARATNSKVSVRLSPHISKQGELEKNGHSKS